MRDERMWTYQELKYISVHQYKMDMPELASEVNGRFHGGMEVRSPADVARIGKAKTIFNRDKKGGRV